MKFFSKLILFSCLIFISGCSVRDIPIPSSLLHPTYTFKVNFFDIGQGDAALIHFRNDENLLVDCGPDKDILEKLGNTLGSKRTLEYLLITHFDLDHYGGCIDVLKRYEVKNIIINGQRKEDDFWQEWNTVANNEHTSTTIIAGKKNLEIASTTLEFVFPLEKEKMKQYKLDSNNFSIVFRLIDQETQSSILFTGDLELPGEEVILSTYCSNFRSSTESCPQLKSNTVKAGHHGSDTSSGQDFLEAIDPEEAVISVGKQNKFGHPSRRILKRLERLGITILRTDEKGDILY